MDRHLAYRSIAFVPSRRQKLPRIHPHIITRCRSHDNRSVALRSLYTHYDPLCYRLLTPKAHRVLALVVALLCVWRAQCWRASYLKNQPSSRRSRMMNTPRGYRKPARAQGTARRWTRRHTGLMKFWSRKGEPVSNFADRNFFECTPGVRNRLAVPWLEQLP